VALCASPDLLCVSSWDNLNAAAEIMLSFISTAFTALRSRLSAGVNKEIENKK